MDHHLAGADEFGSFKPLQQASCHHIADQLVLAVDLEAPERTMDSEPAAIAIERRLDVARGRTPIAIEDLCPEEILDFQVALSGQQPVPVRSEGLQRKGSAQ